MKKIIVMAWLCVVCSIVKAQSDEAQQLILNVEKLAQFKKILQNMKDGYQILFKGYTAVKGISEGDFKLHKVFLDALLEVSPAVKKYKRVSDIISYQTRIVKEYKSAFAHFKQEQTFTTTEINYLGKVYSNLFRKSLQSLDDLAMILTAGKLRMSDDERLQAIDKIYTAVVDQYSFLKDFNNSASYLSLQRKSEKAKIDMLRKIYGY
jgi:hypothetical protein